MVVGDAYVMISAVPGVNRLAHDIIQHPSLACLHAGLMDAISGFVLLLFFGWSRYAVVIACDQAVAGVVDFALVAFDVENHPRAVELLRGRVGWRGITALELVVSDGEKYALKHI